MYCSQCGTPIHDKSKFCYKCGARVLTVPEPEEGQDAEAGERQSSRGSEGRERRGGRSSEKDPESGADGAGSARAAAPAVKPAPVKVSQAKAPAAKPQKSAAPVKKAQADAPKQLPYEKSAGVIRDLLRMLPRETFDGDDDRLRMLDDGVRICSSVADGSYDGSFFRLALDFTDNIVIRKQDESEAPDLRQLLRARGLLLRRAGGQAVGAEGHGRLHLRARLRLHGPLPGERLKGACRQIIGGRLQNLQKVP